MSFKLIAVGDIHFDSPSLFGDDERKKLENLKKDAFKRAVDEAVSRNVSAFLICGDLFHEESVSFETLIFLRKHFLQLASCNIKVLYAHGKSDSSAAPEIIRTNNFIDFSHEVERYELIGADGVPEAIIYASGYSSGVSHLAGQFEEKESSYPTIGLMYDGEGFKNQNSFVLDSLAGLNYDLFILGGYHHYLIARPESNIVYTGSPTGTWFGDRAGGALYAEINGYGQMVLDKIPLSDAVWHDIEIGNIQENDMGSLKRRIETEIQSQVTSVKDAFVRVRLSGRCPFADSFSDEEIKEMANELSNTLDVAVFVKKDGLLPTLPKSLFDSTSPFVESVKIIDSIKNDDEKFEKILSQVEKKDELFYSTVNKEKISEYRTGFKEGLVDTICKVMIKEAGYEN